MTSLILKPDCSLSTTRPDTMFLSPSGLGRAMLLLNHITGAVLGGIGVMVLVANVLLGCVLLILGPDFTIGLLAQ